MTSEQKVKSRIANDLKDHVVTALRNDGLYRHYRCAKPKDSSMSFEVITWPGALCYTGDMGDYLFQRTNDMIAFMRGSCMSYCYVAEKCVAYGREGIKEFSAIEMERELAQVVAEADSDEIEDAIEKADEIRSAAEDGEYYAIEAMRDSDLWDCADMPSCEDYTFHFLWCLHAMKWFCERVE